MTDYMVDLNALDKDGEVECPYCMKIVSFSYGALFIWKAARIYKVSKSL